jgi:hypothetical protein
VSPRTATATLPARTGLRAAIGRWLPPLVWIAVFIGAAGALAIAYFFYRGDPDGAARVANREIEAELRPGERVLQRVPVRRRYWWDYLRITHGVLAATDTRLIYVGVPPEPLLRIDDGPPELDVSDYVYATHPVVTRDRTAFGMRSSVIIQSGETRDIFGVAAGDEARMQSVLGVLDRVVSRLAAAAEAERRAAQAAAAASRRAIYHLVQRGEALTGIAQRYGVPVDSLMAWNNLASSRIVSGRRLLVRPEIK